MLQNPHEQELRALFDKLPAAPMNIKKPGEEHPRMISFELFKSIIDIMMHKAYCYGNMDATMYEGDKLAELSLQRL